MAELDSLEQQPPEESAQGGARQSRRQGLRRELAKGEWIKASDVEQGLRTTTFVQDIKEIANAWKSIQDLLSLTNGPVPLKLEKRKPQNYRLPWAPLAQIIAAPEYQAQRAIATCLLESKVGDEYILPRGANVVLGPPGSGTAFVVALVLAELLVTHIENPSTSTFQPITGDWHMDMLFAAVILGRLPRTIGEQQEVIGPRVHLNGIDISPLSGTSTEVAPWAVSMLSSRAVQNRSLSTVVLGCRRIDNEGRIYTGIENHAEEFEGYLKMVEDAPKNRVIFIAAHDKLGSSESGHMIRFENNMRKVFIVTDREPDSFPLPPGFSYIVWPGKQPMNDWVL